MRLVELAGDDFFQARAGDIALEQARLVVEALQRAEFFVAAEPGLGTADFSTPIVSS